MKNLPMARALRTARTACPAAACAIALLLALGAAAGAPAASAAQAATVRRQTILVLPFDLYDFSLDRRAQTVVPLHHWAAALAGQMAGKLRHDSALRVLSDSTSIAALRKVRINYSHPTACRRCMISVARHAGARLVVIGQVHKLSNLITYFNVEIVDVHTGRVVHEINMRADGADTNSMWRHIAQNLADSVDRAIAHTH